LTISKWAAADHLPSFTIGELAKVDRSLLQVRWKAAKEISSGLLVNSNNITDKYDGIQG